MTPKSASAPLAPAALAIFARKPSKIWYLSVTTLSLAIGAGLFLGTGSVIHQVGLVAIVSYTLAAIIVVSVMLVLVEPASSLPSTEFLSSYTEAGIGRWAGFAIGWLYWVMLIMMLGLGVTGAVTFFVDWLPAVPRWVAVLAIVAVIGSINLLAAGQHGEIEAWLSMVRIAMIITFLGVGAYLVARTAIVGPLLGYEGVLRNVLGHSGLAPNGLSDIVVALLAAIAPFGGLEIVTIAAVEAGNPRAAMSNVVRPAVTRILVFYVRPVILLITLLPWDNGTMNTNAFVAILKTAGVLTVGMLMNVIAFMALISVFSANICASSRVAYLLSARNMGPCWLLDTSASNKACACSAVEAALEDDEIPLAIELQGDIEVGRTPKRAVGLVVVPALLVVLGNWYLSGSILTILVSAIGMVLLIAWTFIIISLMRLHPPPERSGPLAIRILGWPWLLWLALVGLGGTGVPMLVSDEGRVQLVSIGVLTLVVVAIYFVRQLVGSRKRT